MQHRIQFSPSLFLRRVLLVDATTSAAAGLLMLFGANVLQEPLGLSSMLLRYSGLSLLPFAALLVYLATRERITTSIVWAIIVANVLWVAISILILLAGWVGPTSLGYAFVIGQALAVAVFVELEYLGLQRSAEPAV